MSTGKDRDGSKLSETPAKLSPGESWKRRDGNPTWAGERYENLRAENYILTRCNKRAQDELMRQAAKILGLKAERDQLAARVEQLKADYDSQNLTDLSIVLNVLGERNKQLALARQALIKLSDYNSAIAEDKINYRPEDHIQVAEEALAQLTPAAALEEHDRAVRKETGKLCITILRTEKTWLDGLKAIRREFGLEGK